MICTFVMPAVSSVKAVVQWKAVYMTGILVEICDMNALDVHEESHVQNVFIVSCGPYRASSLYSMTPSLAADCGSAAVAL